MTPTILNHALPTWMNVPSGLSGSLRSVRALSPSTTTRRRESLSLSVMKRPTRGKDWLASWYQLVLAITCAAEVLLPLRTPPGRLRPIIGVTLLMPATRYLTRSRSLGRILFHLPIIRSSCEVCEWIDSVLPPIPWNSFMTDCVSPCNNDTMQMTDATPMMTPSMVRKLRMRCERMLPSAERTHSCTAWKSACSRLTSSMGAMSRAVPLMQPPGLRRCGRRANAPCGGSDWRSRRRG